jgi:cytochrome c556
MKTEKYSVKPVIPGSMSGIKKITDKILPMDKVRAVQQATFFIPSKDGYDLATADYSYEERVVPTFSVHSMRNWGLNVGLCGWGEYSDFATYGDCGNPIIGHFDGSVYLIGVHAAKRNVQKKWASVVITKELLKDIQDDEAHALEKDNVENGYTFPSELESKLLNKKIGTPYEPRGAVKVINYVRNYKPMDAKNDRIQYNDFKNTLEGFAEKAPALSVGKIFTNHRDKIPLDARGLPHVHLIRTKVLETNYYDESSFFKLIRLAEEMADYYKLQLNITKLNPMSIEDAVFGNYQALSIDTTTSAGVTMSMITGKRMKRDFIDPFNREIDEELMGYIRQQYAMAQEGKRLSFPADANLKAETLPIEKVWKKRVFYNVPLPTVVNLKRLLAPIQHAFTAQYVKSPFLFGLYPTRDWDSLASELVLHSNNIVCLDVKAYDHGLKGHLIKAAGVFFASFYQHENEPPRPRLRRVFSTLFEEVARMPLIFENVIVEKQGGLPSGTWGTSIIDGVAWDIMLYVIWRDVTSLNNFYSFKTHVKSKYVGDDVILSVSNDYRDIFNGKVIAERMLTLFDLTVTPAADKSGVLQPYLPLEQAYFCSCFFMRHPEHRTLWMPRIKEESIYSALTYSRYTDYDDLYTQYLQCRLEIVGYGKMKYDEFERELSQFAAKHRIPHEPMPYETALDSIWQVITSPDKNFIKSFVKYTLNSERIERVNMSSTKTKELKLRVARALCASSSSKEFSAWMESSGTLDTMEHLNNDNLIEWTDLQKWACPGTNVKYEGIRQNTMTALACLAGCVPCDIIIQLSGWVYAKESELDSDRAQRFNEALEAHKALVLYNRDEPVSVADLMWFLTIPNQIKRDDEAHAATGTALPEVVGAGEGGAIMTGASNMGQMDPMMAPMMTTTPAVAATSQEITDSDGIVIPTIIDTVGGLGPIGLANTNYADNVVSLCNKQIYVRRYNISSSTSAGTIIDEMDFDPWNDTVVSRPISQYGSLHQVFNGSIDFVLNSYSAATIVGSVIITYVPPLLQKNFISTLENLKTLPSAVLNLKVGGSSKLTVTGGNLTDCAVVRAKLEDGSSLYGKIIIAAYTDIVNSYGVSVSIPVVRTTALGPDAYFSHPQYLISNDTGGGGGGGILDPGPMPNATENLILDSSIVYKVADTQTVYPYYNLEQSGNGFTFFPTIRESNLAFNVLGSGTSEDLSITPGYWFGSNKWGTGRAIIEQNIHPKWSDSTVDGFPPQPWSDVDPGLPFGIDPEPTSLEYSGLLARIGVVGAEHMLFRDTTTSRVTRADFVPDVPTNTPITAAWTYINGLTNQTDAANNHIGRWDLFWDNPPTVVNNGASDNRVDAFLNSVVSSIFNAEKSFYLAPTMEFAGAPVCSKAIPRDSCPAGYIALYFDIDSPIIPLVQPTINNSQTLPYPKEHNRFMHQANFYFARRPDVESYSYDVTLTSGESLCTILVNRSGCFVYNAIATTSGYYTFPNASSLVYLNYQSYNTEFPAIQEANLAQFLNRVLSTTESSVSKAFGNMQIQRREKPLPIEFRMKDIEDRMSKMDIGTFDPVGLFNALKPIIAKASLSDTEKTILNAKLKDAFVADEAHAMTAFAIGASAAGNFTSTIGAGIGGIVNRRWEEEMQKRELRYKTGWNLLDYNQAMRTGRLRYDAEKYRADMAYKSQMARFGYNASSQVSGNTGTLTDPSTPQDMTDYSPAGPKNKAGTAAKTYDRSTQAVPTMNSVGNQTCKYAPGTKMPVNAGASTSTASPMSSAAYMGGIKPAGVMKM